MEDGEVWLFLLKQRDCFSAQVRPEHVVAYDRVVDLNQFSDIKLVREFSGQRQR
jgi:hypothetical protein